MTATGLIQSTIYHIRQNGHNVYDPEEREKYYSDDFLNNVRTINDRVEQELEEFKIEIDEKVELNSTKYYVFPRSGVQRHYNEFDDDTDHLDYGTENIDNF